MKIEVLMAAQSEISFLKHRVAEMNAVLGKIRMEVGSNRTCDHEFLSDVGCVKCNLGNGNADPHEDAFSRLSEQLMQEIEDVGEREYRA